MTKQFPVITINGEHYIMDEKAPIPHIHPVYDTISGKIGYPISAMKAGEFNCYKIIAATDKYLGLPLIPLDDDANLAFNQEYKNYSAILYGEESKPFKMAWMKGYKAAKGEKKYTEDDVRKAIRLARETTYGNNWKTESESEIIKSLIPILKAVELEMEVDADDERNWYIDCPSGKYWEDEPIPPSRDRLYTDAKYLKPKLTKDNYVIVKRFIYEKL